MSAMKFAVLIWAVFQMFSITTSDQTNSATESYTLINSTKLAKPGCNSTCGDLIVPYPFGIGDNPECYVNEGFRIYCNTSVNPPKATITRSKDYSSIKLISDSTVRITNIVASMCYFPNGTTSSGYDISLDYRLGWPYTISKVNKLTLIGCDDYAWLTSATKSRNVSTGCIVFCPSREEVVGDECTGNGCCQSSIPQDINYYYADLNSLLHSRNVSKRSFAPCTYAFVGEENIFKFNGTTDLINSTSFLERTKATVPIVLEWAIGNLSCSEAGAKDGFACQSNSNCVSSTRESGGYRCVCSQGYKGNPYLSLGCQDINECEDPRNYPCSGICLNTLGGYKCNCLPGAIADAKVPNNCICPPGSNGDPKIKNGCKAPKDSKSTAKVVIIATVFSLIAIVCATMGIFFSLRRRRLMRLREKFFEQNGGALLKQKINSQGTHDTMTLFSSMQLRKATNNYSQEKIVGRGGYGVVYKGVLSDNRVVAIKKSKIVDGSQAEQFINEVLILTQVIHRNVVKLLGCCLEEEVPVLVYEFISNNTLYHHIHHRLGGMSWLSWEHRLRIAAEAAGALAYLHSETIMPIIHRDVKSANILLDDNYTVKVSDFGASRLVPLDHEQVTTMIQGTLGYLDPQYYHTSQLTEKSDVYSFGVVLAELITGKIPIGSDRINEEKNLATYFVNSVQENRLFVIVEPRLLREGTLDKLHTLANLVKRCLSLQSHDRPTMKEVAMELDGLRKFTTHPWIPETGQETRSLVLEVEQSDLYDAPLVSNGPNESDSYFVSRSMAFEENEPR